MARHEEDKDGMLKPLLPRGLPEEAISGELAYRTCAAKYKEMLSRLRQIDAEIADGPSPARMKELGNIRNGICGHLGSLRTIARDAGELSYATVFVRLANELLSRECMRDLDSEVQALMRRPRHEIFGQKNDAGHQRVKGFADA